MAASVASITILTAAFASLTLLTRFLMIAVDFLLHLAPCSRDLNLPVFLCAP